MKNKDLVYGIHAIEEAIDSGREPNKIMIKKGLGGDLFYELKKLLGPHKDKIQYVPAEKLNRLTKGNHQGVIALFSPVNYSDLELIIPGVFEKGESPFVLILDGVTDVRNFGAIARSAECCGVHAIVIPQKGGAQITSDAVKTSAGALNRIAVCRVKFLQDAIEYLKNSGCQIVACTEKGEKNISDADLTSGTAVIMGSEDTGVSPVFRKMCDLELKIPMTGVTNSLNVAVAAGVICYERLRQLL